MHSGAQQSRPQGLIAVQAREFSGRIRGTINCMRSGQHTIQMSGTLFAFDEELFLYVGFLAVVRLKLSL